MNESESRLQTLLVDYQSLNYSSIREITNRIPTPVELSRSIASNRPLVIRSYAQLQANLSPGDDIDMFYHHELRAFHNWSDSQLIEKMSNQLIDVARTPSGKADSVVDGKYFVEPAYEKMTMSNLLAELRASQMSDKRPDGKRDVVYLQSQDNNLSKQLLPLLPDVGSHVPIASDALGTDEPDAVNLWIGDDRSITSLHNDPYENFYLMIEGSKTFTLYPPVEVYCMHEGDYRSSIYQQNKSDRSWSIIPNPEKDMVPWIPVDPLDPDYTKFPRFKLARPMTVTLKEGDLLYLPSLWYHHVQAHRTSSNGLVISCNWWYDMNYGGAHYALFSHLRREVIALDQP